MEKTQEDQKELKWYLRALRKAHFYSQEYVASKLHIQRQTYSHYETGRITPPVATLYRIADLYGVPVENLLELSVQEILPSTEKKRAAVLQEQDQGWSVNKMPTADVQAYMDYMKEPLNRKKLQCLENEERQLIYYYENLDAESKETAMTVIKALSQRNRGKV